MLHYIIPFLDHNPIEWCMVNCLISRGKLFGIFSAKCLYLISVVMFEVGSAVCGAAPNMNAMVVGRAVAGLGVSAHPRFLISSPRGTNL